MLSDFFNLKEKIKNTNKKVQERKKDLIDKGKRLGKAMDHPTIKLVQA